MKKKRIFESAMNDANSLNEKNPSVSSRSGVVEHDFMYQLVLGACCQLSRPQQNPRSFGI